MVFTEAECKIQDYAVRGEKEGKGIPRSDGHISLGLNPETLLRNGDLR